ncbi:MAG: NAD(P)/FAD-dependent oxidoreductase [Paracoccaceae bacterium]
MAGRYLTANDRTGEHPASWYVDTAGPIPEHASLKGETRADVCVVGAGYAGLSAAIHLAEAGLDVVVLDANRVGWGASGRNGGQLGVGPREDVRAYERLVGPDDARKVWALGLEATKLVRGLVDRFSIDAQLSDGALEVAWKPAHAREIAEHAEHMARAYDYHGIEPVDAAAVAERLATTRYHGGALWHEGGHLHPLRFALGLAQVALDLGVRLRERSRVVRVAPGRVETGTGAVVCERVVVAANGYLDGLVPEVARRSMPINNFLIATEPMDAARAERLIRDDLCVSDTKFVLDYYRLTPDRRVLWGGGESYGARFPRDIAGLVRGKMLAVFPDLADLRVTHAWGGTLAITATRFPAFQRLDGGTLAISGWSGAGLHMATMGGKLAAAAILGEDARFDLMTRLPTPPFPGGDWFRAPALALAMTWYGLRDRL